jgi:hypothetical protein
MPASLYCKHCMSFVPHTFVPVVPPDRRLRIKAVCTHCDRAGARIGHTAEIAVATIAVSLLPEGEGEDRRRG